MLFGSVCSGIEAASVAWHPLGWRAAWVAEIEPFPSAVLAHHFPQVPNLGDMTQIAAWVRAGFVTAPDVLVGGTPCQAFSVAGARKSLDDDRGQLSLEFIRLADAIDEQRNGNESIIVWENVPGVLNTKDNAFGCFLGALAGESRELQPTGGRWGNAGCVFGPQRAIAWRVLDAQHFGVAQRRRRVFVVASAREGFNPAKVLFEFDGVRRDTPPSRSAGQETAGSVGTGPYLASGKPAVGTLMANAGTKLWLGNQEAFSGDYFVCHGTQDPIIQDNQAFPLGRNHGQGNVVFGIPGNWIGRKPENGGNAVEPMDNIAPCQTKTDRHAVAHGFSAGQSPKAGSIAFQEEIAPTLRSGSSGTNQVPAMLNYGLVRRLTPTECERLQGFPDGWTKIPYRNKPMDDCPDGPRYAALGNSMAVPVMAWIGERIAKELNK